MTFYVIAKHPIETRRILVLSLTESKIEWGRTNNNVRLDLEYNNDLTNNISLVTDTDKIERFLWNNKDKKFDSVRIIQVFPKSKYDINQGNDWELIINQSLVGLLSDQLEPRDVERMKDITKNGGLLIVDNNLKEPWILRIVSKPTEVKNSDKENNSRTKASSYSNIPQNNKNSNLKQTSNVPKNADYNNYNPSNEPSQKRQTNAHILERFFEELVEKPVEPIKESLDRIERKTNEIIGLKDSIARLEMRMRNMYAHYPVNNTNTDKSSEEVEKLKKELEEAKMIISSYEIQINDTNNRLQTSENRINDNLRKRFSTSFAQLEVYNVPEEKLIISEETFEKILKLYSLSTEDTKSLKAIYEQNLHMQHTLNLLVRVFNDLGWL